MTHQHTSVDIWTTKGGKVVNVECQKCFRDGQSTKGIKRAMDDLLFGGCQCPGPVAVAEDDEGIEHRAVVKREDGRFEIYI